MALDMSCYYTAIITLFLEHFFPSQTEARNIKSVFYLSCL